MPCEDGQHEKYEPDKEDNTGDYKYCDFVIWKNEAKDRLIRIQLCKNCKLLYWDEVIEKRVFKVLPGFNILEEGEKKRKIMVNEWNQTHSEKIIE